MKKILAALTLLAVACSCVVAQAQSQPQSQAQPQPQPQVQAQPQPAIESQAHLNERFNACLSNKDCSIQVRLQIIQEENDEMNNRFQKIHQVCADANFQDCIGRQKADVDAWYAAQNNMQKLMQSMQTQGLNEKEPAAGGPSSSADSPSVTGDNTKKSF